MPTCEQFARVRLAQRPIKESTYKEYLTTLRLLGLSDVPMEDVSVSMLTTRLGRVLNPGTRRKHSINLRACLGFKLPCTKGTQKIYQLPENEALHQALAQSPYAMHGFVMLYAGLRLGEACVSQPLEGNILKVDRQVMRDGSIGASKTTGPVFIPQWLADAYKGYDFEAVPNSIYVAIRAAGRKSGLKLNPHQLRHAYATNLVAAGATPEVLRRQMRHHDVVVSLRYYVQTTDNDVMRAVDGL